jgi:hypothetical protein
MNRYTVDELREKDDAYLEYRRGEHSESTVNADRTQSRCVPSCWRTTGVSELDRASVILTANASSTADVTSSGVAHSLPTGGVVR